jgi:hypothetical protein
MYVNMLKDIDDVFLHRAFAMSDPHTNKPSTEGLRESETIRDQTTPTDVKTSPVPSTPSEKIGRYLPLRRLGRGGMDI